MPSQFCDDLVAHWQRPSPQEVRLLDHVRSVLEETLPSKAVEALGLLPPRLNPPVIPHSQAEAYWTGLLEADGGVGGRITTVHLDDLTAFVDKTNFDPGINWLALHQAHHHRPVTWFARLVQRLVAEPGDDRLTAAPSVDPQSRHLEVCAQLSQAHPVRVVVQFDLWTWLGREGPARDTVKRTFQIRLVDLAQEFQRLTEVEDLNLSGFDRRTRLQQSLPLARLTQLVDSLDSVIHNPELPSQARTRLAQTLQYAPRYSLDKQDLVVVLAQLYRSLNVAGLEVIDG